MAQIYKASKNRSQGREGWCALFRHPLRRDKEGKNQRIRKGLRTKDAAEADKLIEQLNRLLQDETYWPLSEKGRASREMDPRVISIFYDDIETRALENPWLHREAEIPLPTAQNGYATVLLVGTTGAGKTTLLRQIIGTDPKKDRFPSTSTAKTTTFDIEIICQDGPYRAVVSFLSRERVRLYIEECVVAAITTAVEESRESVILKRFLEHSDQRFRLSYVLGNLRTSSIEDEVDEVTDEPLDQDLIIDTDSLDEDVAEIGSVEQKEIEARLRSFLDRIIEIAHTASQQSAAAYDLNVLDLTPEEQDEFIQRIEESLRENEEVQTLIDDVLDEVETRFSFLEDDQQEGQDAAWPKVWTFESDDRNIFIKTINQFSSNYSPNFGRLLAPLVQGMRVSGPFHPNWHDENAIPSLVLIDGEGLGHTPESAFSLPTSITKRYEKVDLILLVDNATQPMQAGAQAVLRSIAVSGHGAKLAIVFTHFDQVRGDNLPNQLAKKNHVMASLNNAISGLETVFGDGIGRALSRQLENRIFFASNIQEKLSPGARFTRRELSNLLRAFETSIEPIEIGKAVPVYDLGNLVLGVRKANEMFNEYWLARLKLRYKTGIDAEHWTRIKALSRRFAEQWNEDYYDNLRPVADMVRFLSEAMLSFILHPRGWKTPNSSEEEKQEAVDRVRQEFFKRLHNLAHRRLFVDHVAEWGEAYDQRGTGSTLERARHIRYIYEDAAPIPGEAPDPAANKLLDMVRSIFKEAAEEAGAEFVTIAMAE